MRRLRDKWLVKHNIVTAIVLIAIITTSFSSIAWLRAIALFLLFAPIYWKTHYEEDLTRW